MKTHFIICAVFIAMVLLYFCKIYFDTRKEFKKSSGCESQYLLSKKKALEEFIIAGVLVFLIFVTCIFGGLV